VHSCREMIVEMEVDPHRAETSWGIHRYLRVRVSFSLSLRLCVCVCVCLCGGMGRPAQIGNLGSHVWLMDHMSGIFRARCVLVMGENVRMLLTTMDGHRTQLKQTV
jgi:hypothetical protein